MGHHQLLSLNNYIFFVEGLCMKKCLLDHLMLALDACRLHVETPLSLVFLKHTLIEVNVFLLRAGLSQQV